MKGYYGYNEGIFRKDSKEIKYAYRINLRMSYCLSRVTVLEFLGFQEPLYDRSKEKVPCASAIGSIISAQKNLP